MGSDNDLRTIFNLRIMSIAVVIALLVGAGAGYMVGNSPVSSLMEEIDSLELEHDSLDFAFQGPTLIALSAELNSTQELLVEEQKDNALLRERYLEMKNNNVLIINEENQVLTQQVIDLEAEIDSLQDYIEHFEGKYEELHDSFVEIEKNYEVLQAAYESLNQSYSDLLSCIDSTVIDSYSQIIEYNISAGTDRTWEFLIPEYGIIWEARISFNGWMVKTYQFYRIGDAQYLIGAGSTSLITEGYDWIPYYGPQDYLWGTLELEYYLNERHEDEVWIIATMRSQLPTIGNVWNAHISLPGGGHPP